MADGGASSVATDTSVEVGTWASANRVKLGSTEANPRRFLIISAPFGPFSRQLAAVLEARGATCARVILNGGDLLDWGPRQALFYQGVQAGWRGWLARTLSDRRVTDIICYGD